MIDNYKVLQISSPRIRNAKVENVYHEFGHAFILKLFKYKLKHIGFLYKYGDGVVKFNTTNENMKHDIITKFFVYLSGDISVLRKFKKAEPPYFNYKFKSDDFLCFQGFSQLCMFLPIKTILKSISKYTTISYSITEEEKILIHEYVNFKISNTKKSISSISDKSIEDYTLFYYVISEYLFGIFKKINEFDSICEAYVGKKWITKKTISEIESVISHFLVKNNVVINLFDK